MKELYDKDMREALFSYFEDSIEHIRFLEEVTMGRSRADAIMISQKEMVGFEVKSDKDSLVRLKRQIPDYDKYFDRNYLVIGEHFENKAKEVLPSHWGIIKIWDADDNGNLMVCEIRTATNNPQNPLRKQLDFLWRDELIHIMKTFNLGGVTKKSKKVMRDLMYKTIDIKILKDNAMNELLEREYPVIYSYTYHAKCGEIYFITDAKVIKYITFIKPSDKYVIKDDISLHEEIKKQFDDYFSGRIKQFELPLEKQRFNSFSRKVYQSLSKIPYGETTSYAQIAAMAGRPTAYRAVGMVNNRNPYPIIVPCHRVVSANGKLTGYAGGIDMKKYLLDMEDKYK